MLTEFSKSRLGKPKKKKKRERENWARGLWCLIIRMIDWQVLLLLCRIEI
jgi:hypothetical protein